MTEGENHTIGGYVLNGFTTSSSSVPFQLYNSHENDNQYFFKRRTNEQSQNEHWFESTSSFVTSPLLHRTSSNSQSRSSPEPSWDTSISRSPSSSLTHSQQSSPHQGPVSPIRKKLFKVQQQSPFGQSESPSTSPYKLNQHHQQSFYRTDTFDSFHEQKRSYKPLRSLIFDDTRDKLFEAQAQYVEPEVEPFSDFEGTCKICCNNGFVRVCGYCEQIACGSCMYVCEDCNSLFCSFCTIPNYDERRERHFCVGCEQHRA
eukprot:m.96763 g.96763  ORF g.96763 m.96763 type:complete len:259 (-) comp8973_c0_seq1:185-961(-)